MKLVSKLSIVATAMLMAACAPRDTTHYYSIQDADVYKRQSAHSLASKSAYCCMTSLIFSSRTLPRPLIGGEKRRNFIRYCPFSLRQKIVFKGAFKILASNHAP